MSVSSVSSAPPVSSARQTETKPLSQREQEQEIELRRQEYKLTPQKKDDDDRTTSPPPRAPLPPGQGTRIDQLA